MYRATVAAASRRWGGRSRLALPPESGSRRWIREAFPRGAAAAAPAIPAAGASGGSSYRAPTTRKMLPTAVAAAVAAGGMGTKIALSEEKTEDRGAFRHNDKRGNGVGGGFSATAATEKGTDEGGKSFEPNEEGNGRKTSKPLAMEGTACHGRDARPKPIVATSFRQTHAPLPGVRELGRALSELHERQKVWLGRLLHDFHRLAWEVAKEDASEQEEVVADNDEVEATDAEYIKVPRDLSRGLSHGSAWDIIEGLRVGGRLHLEDVKRIALAAAQIIGQESTVVDLRGRTGLDSVTVVGDLHGHFRSLSEVMDLMGGRSYNGAGAVVFNGDFVDRGDHSLEVLVTLLLLKIAYPDSVYMNRGNHEDTVLSTVYGFADEVRARYRDSSHGSIEAVWDAFGDVFSALPLCVCTETAAIMHGGIPYDGFKLSDLEAIPPARRSRMKSVLEPGDDAMCQLVLDVLWSDPGTNNGVCPNEDRGAGVYFGPDVTRRFLADHGLKFLVRSHEPVDEGFEQIECGEERTAVTVFSAAQYPCGEGYNWGAVIQLSTDGALMPICFPGQDTTEGGRLNDEYLRRTFGALAELIVDNEFRLSSAFSKMAKSNEEQSSGGEENIAKKRTMITREQWAQVMSSELDLYHMDWLSLQPYMAPTVLEETETALPADCSPARTFTANPTAAAVHGKDDTRANLRDTGMIDYQKFLDLHCHVLSCPGGMQQLDKQAVQILRQNHAVLLTVFKFLDTDRNGRIDREEFRAGMELLNARFPEGPKFEDVDTIFDAIDFDGNGEIELEEFEKAFQAMEMPYSVAVFKLFDTDHNGTLDKQEFREALKMLNNRLPQKQQFVLGEADALFDDLDVDGNGELELEEFQKVMRDYLPEKV